MLNPFTPRVNYGDINVILTSESVDEILKCDHSNESYWAVLSCGDVYYVVQGGSNFWVCGWNPMVWPFKWKLVSGTFTWYYLYLSVLQNWIWNLSGNLILGILGSERVKLNKFFQLVLNRLRGEPRTVRRICIMTVALKTMIFFSADQNDTRKCSTLCFLACPHKIDFISVMWILSWLTRRYKYWRRLIQYKEFSRTMYAHFEKY